MQLKLSILLSILFPVFLNAQTCIIAFRTPDNIVVGADTRFAVSYIKIKQGRKTYLTAYDTICKIIRIKNYYFSATGYDYLQMLKTSAESCVDGKDLESIARIYMKRELPLFKSYLIKMKKDTDYYRSHFEDLQTLNSVIFYGFENHIPKIIEVSMQMSSEINKPVKIDTSTSKMIDRLTNSTDHILMGHKDAILADFNSIDFWNTWGIVEGIKNLIRKEAAAAPNAVSEPIDILNLKDGVEEWIQRPVCALPNKRP